MAKGYSSLGHTFNLTEVSFRGAPVPNQVFNEFDYHGTLVGTKRLKDESNLSYKERLLDTYVHRASSSYRGLLNAVTRDLGYEFFSPVSIKVKDTVPATLFPKIDFVENVVYVWSDIYNKTLEMNIDRGEKTKPEYFLTHFIDTLNTSTSFEITLLDSTYLWHRSDIIVNGSNTGSVVNQQLLSSQVNYLGNKFIYKGSVVFQDRETFRSEVTSANLVNSPGKYHVDYSRGIITSFGIPVERSFLSYRYRIEDYRPEASPIIIRDINTEEFRKLMFVQNPQPDGIFTHGAPTEKGASIINEVLSVKESLWGI
jgi:hypothetical protein